MSIPPSHKMILPLKQPTVKANRLFALFAATGFITPMKLNNSLVCFVPFGGTCVVNDYSVPPLSPFRHCETPTGVAAIQMPACKHASRFPPLIDYDLLYQIYWSVSSTRLFFFHENC